MTTRAKRVMFVGLQVTAWSLWVALLTAAASYPTSIKSFTTKIQGDTVNASHINDLQDEVVAIETQLITQGTWTPAIASSGGGAATYSLQQGYYNQVGKRIYVSGIITLATKGTLAAGTITITGLPVAVAGSNAYSGLNVSYYVTMTTSVASLGGYLVPSTSTAQLVHVPAAGAVSSVATTVADIGATLQIIFSGFYFTT
jgi:hypothetical protein